MFHPRYLQRLGISFSPDTLFFMRPNHIFFLVQLLHDPVPAEILASLKLTF